MCVFLFFLSKRSCRVDHYSFLASLSSLSYISLYVVIPCKSIFYVSVSFCFHTLYAHACLCVCLLATFLYTVNYFPPWAVRAAVWFRYAGSQSHQHNSQTGTFHSVQHYLEAVKNKITPISNRPHHWWKSAPHKRLRLCTCSEGWSWCFWITVSSIQISSNYCKYSIYFINTCLVF